MAKRRVLVQWIGHSDLRAVAGSLSAVKRDEIMAVIKGELPKEGDLGPIKTLIKGQQCDEICMLSNYPDFWNKMFKDRLAAKATVVQVELKKLTDYGTIFKVCSTPLSSVPLKESCSRDNYPHA
jgi:hypothetical protein